MSVLPVPGGPYISAPFGGLIPMFSKRSLCVIGSTIASTCHVARHRYPLPWWGARVARWGGSRQLLYLVVEAAHVVKLLHRLLVHLGGA